MRSLVLLALVMSFSCPALCPAQELGTVEGQFLLDGKSPLAEAPRLVKKGDAAVGAPFCAKADIPNEILLVDPETGGIADIVVYLRKAPAGMPAALKTPAVKEIAFDQKDCRFVPRILPVQIGQTINCTSQDPIGHNVHVTPFVNAGINLMVAGNAPKPTPVVMKDSENLPVLVVCDLHTWMIAHWVVTDHPYVAVTDSQGKFSISGLPPGEHSLTVWHQTGYVPSTDARTLKVTVKTGNQVIPPIRVPAAHFDKRIKESKQKKGA